MIEQNCPFQPIYQASLPATPWQAADFRRPGEFGFLIHRRLEELEVLSQDSQIPSHTKHRSTL
jgi:hypothetical protein